MRKIVIKISKLTLIVAIILLSSGVMFGQNNTSSPYSMYGIGETTELVNGRSAGMGGAGMALRSNKIINPLNPASLTSLDSMNFYYDIGLMSRVTWARSSSEKNRLIDGNVTGVSIATRVNKRWYAAAGFAPKSSIGYNIRYDYIIDGIDIPYSSYWSGTGGFTELYLDNGFLITERLSLGLHTAFMFGPMNHYKNTVVVAPGSVETTTKSSEGGYYGFSGAIGFQYVIPVKDEGASLTLGGNYDIETNLYGKYEELIIQTSSSNGYRDTLEYSGDKISSGEKLPQGYGVGIAYSSKDDFTATIDFKQSFWNSVETSDSIYKDQTGFAAGLEYIPNRKSRNYINKIAYRLGGGYDNGYLLLVEDQPITSWNLTAGVGLPVGNNNNQVNFAIQFGNKGTFDDRLVRERFLGFTLSFNFSDIWYVKRKFN